MSVPRMRTIKQAIEEIKTRDHETAFTEWALRRAISSGEIPYLTAGNKTLVNMDVLEKYLSGEFHKAKHIPKEVTPWTT